MQCLEDFVQLLVMLAGLRSGFSLEIFKALRVIAAGSSGSSISGARAPARKPLAIASVAP